MSTPARIENWSTRIVLLLILAVACAQTASAQTGSISASPNPCTVTTPGGTCTLTLNWSTTGATAARVFVTDANGAEQQLTYTYDGNRRISSVRDWNGFEANYTYDAAGRLTSVRYPNGLSSQYSYDSVGRNVRILHRNGSGVLYSETTTWSANGNPTESDISGLTSPGLPSESTTYAYNDANQLSASTFGVPVHDKNGNLTVQPDFGGTTTLSYDLNNRATAITGPSVNATMKYFGDGKLAELTVEARSRRFLLDPTAASNRILAELDESGRVQTAYAYSPLGMLSQIAGNRTHAYFHNLQGSTVALVDSTGSINGSYHYDPFGQELQASGDQASNPFAFLGSFGVFTIGQYSLTTFRLYDSRTGRFTSPDPIAFLIDAQSSPFIYSRQSPLGSVDPSGLDSEDVNLKRNVEMLEFLGELNYGKPVPILAGIVDLYRDVRNSDLSTGKKVQRTLVNVGSVVGGLWTSIVSTGSYIADPEGYDEVKGRVLSVPTAGAPGLYDANGKCAHGPQEVCDEISGKVPSGTVIPLRLATPGHDYSGLGLQGGPALGTALQGGPRSNK